ncbi:MAG: PAS domain-containing protein [Aquamicrobium sp.]|nr:PAS domain-containing protein [Aquamicrobium sp.]
MMDELFFSRTDTRGRILAGNDVFQRVSQYSWEEMTDRPHNIVRHPDMPRAVFFLLWERIRSGLPVGAYVKNRSKDGRHYWVYAVVTPVEDGYLSVRLKPTSALFAAASGLYAAIRAQENESDCKPADSAQRLLKGLKDSGFGTYAAFMAAALSAEMRAREAAVGRNRWPALDQFDELARSAQILLATTARMLELTAAFRYTPSNLRIQAARMGDEGRAIGEISTNYGRISESIVSNLQELYSAAEEVFSTVNDGLFLACTARLQEEMARFFDLEISGEDVARRQEAARLLRQTEDYAAHAAQKFDLIKARIARFFELTGEMKRLVSGLVAVRVMGKVESVNMYNGMFRELISDLEQGQADLSAGLNEIWNVNNRISDNIRHIENSR